MSLLGGLFGGAAGAGELGAVASAGSIGPGGVGDFRSGATREPLVDFLVPGIVNVAVGYGLAIGLEKEWPDILSLSSIHARD